ncbi:MFS transporter [Demequina sp. NBRC 110057]|uniref:MFS transporter n=1 Tax=Demequina sp. NBRC 110057 TaxID=1570346 RepID=UPI000A035F74|nr:MFS transporter [Demequina sp. NBRC 110057]
MSTTATAAPTALQGKKAVLAIVTLGFSSLAAALMQSLVIPIQGELPELLGTTASNTSWVVTATLLAAGVTMPVSGRLADLYGKKPVMVASGVLLLVGSLIVALSSTLVPVIVGRVLQGAAMGYIPIAIAMVREIAPPHLRNQAIAGVSATLGVGGAIGLPLAAWIAQGSDWHLLFWVAAGLAAVMLTLTIVAIPHVRDAHRGRLDWAGAIGLAIGLVSLLVGVSKGNDWGWDSTTTWACIGLGIVVLVAWGFYELRTSDPLVDLRTTARRPVLVTNIGAILIGFGMMAQSIVVPQLLQMPSTTGYGLDQTILQAGLWMAPAGLMMLIFSPVSASLITKWGARNTLALGAAILAVGYGIASQLMNAPWELMVASIICLTGVAIGYAAMPTIVMNNVPEREAASAVGVNSLMRSIGTTVAGAVMAVILTSQTIELQPGVSVPAESSFQWCFVVGAIAAFAGAGIVLLGPHQKGAPAAHGAVVAEAAEEPALTR